MSPLHYAVLAGDIRMVRLLLESGADADAVPHAHDPNSRHTPMMLVPGGCKAIAQLLVDHGANVRHSAFYLSSGSKSMREVVVANLLEKAVVTSSRSELVDIELHWMGGTVTRHEVTRRVRRWSDLSSYEAIVANVQELASRKVTSNEIASHLNDRGYRTCRGTEFTAGNVRQLRSRAPALREER